MHQRHIASTERGSSNIRARHLACFLASLVSTAACMQQQAKEPTSEDQTQTVTYKMPLVSSVEAGKETQERQGVTVSVVPVPFTVADTPSTTCLPIDTSSSNSLLGGLINVNSSDPNAKKQYKITSETGVDFQPKKLTFKLHVLNHTDHVMRLGDTYVKLNVNNQEVELSDSDMTKFHSTVLVPGEEKTFSIGGPDWSHNADASTLDFGLYDLPLSIDKAGNVAERGTFNWTYQAKLVTNTTQTKKTVETVALSPGEAQAKGCPVGPAPVTAAK